MSGESGPPLPAPFLPHPGTPAVPWRTWEQKFELYLLARTGVTPMPAEQRRALLCAIGDEAYRVFDSLPPVVKRDAEDDYTATLRQLREFYTPRQNVIVERFKFRQRGQAPTESTAAFVAALRGLARSCRYGAMESDLIRDVIVEKTPHQRLRERFLQDQDLTLEKVLNLAKSYENAQREAAVIAPAGPAAAAPATTVAKVTNTKRQGQRNKPAQSASDHCTNCGRTDHQPRDAACPARRVVCNACGMKGHFASWCRGGRGGRGGSSAATAQPARRGQKPAVKELHVLACSDTTSPARLTCTLQVTALAPQLGMYPCRLTQAPPVRCSASAVPSSCSAVWPTSRPVPACSASANSPYQWRERCLQLSPTTARKQQFPSTWWTPHGRRPSWGWTC